MARKKLQMSKDQRTSILVAAITAALGCIGTVTAASIGYMGIQDQINRPIHATQTAQANTDLGLTQITSTFTGIVDARIVLAYACFDMNVARIIPTSIHPNTSTGQSEINAAIDNIDNQWAIGPDSQIGLVLTNITNDMNWIILSNTIKAVISPLNTDETEKANVVTIENGGCGSGQSAGSNIRYFPDIVLEKSFDEYAQNVKYAGFDYFTLQPGEAEIFVLHFKCAAPGAYKLSLEMTGTQNNETKLLTITSALPVVCPKSYDSWQWWVGGVIQQGNSYIWNGNGYSIK
jgi:hypothetical protein